MKDHNYCKTNYGQINNGKKEMVKKRLSADFVGKYILLA